MLTTPSFRISDDRKAEVQSVIQDCMVQLRHKHYRGYDPGDLMNTSLSFVKWLPAPLLRLLTIINFYCPINLRPLLRIKPAPNTTAMAVLGKTYLNCYRQTGAPEMLSHASEMMNWLLERAVLIGSTLGWSRVITYQAKAGFSHAQGSTLTFINANAAEFFLDIFELSHEPSHITAARKVCYHFLEHTNRIRYPFGTCLSYVNDASEEVPNASILAGCVLNRFAAVTGDEAALDLSLEILDYTLHRQNSDGSWDYSFHSGNRGKPQYDFHQCYMLDGIRRYVHGLDPERKDRAERAFSLGMEFYVDRMFDRDMYPYWRYPRKYPVDIHNLSHAIYFMARFFDEIPNAAVKCERLLSVLLDEFYEHTRSYFYYQKYPLFMVKHDFFRWNTVWSIYALSFLPFK